MGWRQCGGAATDETLGYIWSIGSLAMWLHDKNFSPIPIVFPSA